MPAAVTTAHSNGAERCKRRWQREEAAPQYDLLAVGKDEQQKEKIEDGWCDPGFDIAGQSRPGYAPNKPWARQQNLNSVLKMSVSEKTGGQVGHLMVCMMPSNRLAATEPGPVTSRRDHTTNA